MLGQRLRRWLNINTTLSERLVFIVLSVYKSCVALSSDWDMMSVNSIIYAYSDYQTKYLPKINMRAS